MLNGDRLNDVPHSTYLGSTVSNLNSSDEEIEKRFSSAAAAFGKLQCKVWKRSGIQTKTKCKERWYSRAYFTELRPALCIGDTSRS